MMMRRPVFTNSGLARRSLLAVGITLVAVATLASLEWLVLRGLGFRPLVNTESFSVLQCCPPQGANRGLLVYRSYSNKPNSSMRYALELYEGPLGENRQTFSWKGLAPSCAVWTGKEGLLAIGGEEGAIYTWDASNSQVAPRSLGRHPGSVTLAADHAGRWLVSSNDRAVCLWDLQARQMKWRRNDLMTTKLVTHPVSDRILCGTAQGEVLELDLATGNTLRTIARHGDGSVECLSVSANGMQVASIGDDRRLIVTDWQRAETVWSRPHHPTSQACFSPAGNTLVSSGLVDDAWTLLTWDAATGEQRAKLMGHKGAILGLAFAPDGFALYSWGTDGTIRTWNIREGVEIDCYTPAIPC
jgi:WD40 repeat protein